MIIGLVAKNAILIVEFAKAEYARGTPLVDAALAGARLRLRPILMTSFAFILGCVPLWTASGSGSVARQVMGTTVIGGMLAASLVAIFLIPVSFYLIEKIGEKIDPCKVYPLAGPCQLVHCHYKCTVYYDELYWSDYPIPFNHIDHRVEVVYIDKDHLRRCGGPPVAATPP